MSNTNPTSSFNEKLDETVVRLSQRMKDGGINHSQASDIIRELILTEIGEDIQIPSLHNAQYILEAHDAKLINKTKTELRNKILKGE